VTISFIDGGNMNNHRKLECYIEYLSPRTGTEFTIFSSDRHRLHK